MLLMVAKVSNVNRMRVVIKKHGCCQDNVIVELNDLWECCILKKKRYVAITTA